MILWDLLVEHGLLPHKGKIKHLLWALYFMKVYATESATCSVLGGSQGAIDPKTLRKWVWPFIYAIDYLTSEVVSVIWLTHSDLHTITRLILKVGRIVAAGMTAS
jgi:hypothetical protein